MTITVPGPDDLGWMHALNEAHAVELSSMSAAAFADHLARARLVRCATPEAGFLIACDQDSDYHSPNFLWFRARHQRFLYIDRVVVAPAARGRGLARGFYEALFALARTEGYPMLACEVNSDPPNPASDAFHAALGFAPVGSARLEDRGKTVTYLACPAAT